jgi:uronate dehydrogenase
MSDGTSEAAAGDRPLVVITGAAGRVGRLTAPALAAGYRLRLVDRERPAGGDLAFDEQTGQVEWVEADLRDPQSWTAVLESADTVVHLAGQPSPQIDAREAVEDVAMPTAHLAAAAVGSGLRRIVYASSIHAMGLYRRDGRLPIDPRWPARPCCEYGSAKVLCENLLTLLVERSSVTVVSLRLGMTGTLPANGFQASHWLGDEDCGALMRCSVTADVRNGAYFGMSNGARAFCDLSPTETNLGFAPRQLPPDPVKPTPEPIGRCLMPREGEEWTATPAGN